MIALFIVLTAWGVSGVLFFPDEVRDMAKPWQAIQFIVVSIVCGLILAYCGINHNCDCSGPDTVGPCGQQHCWYSCDVCGCNSPDGVVPCEDPDYE